uniref:HAT C-terminal dimerisation domain-containing protein n=1 Tax=Lactuca sativa TaxID=4236 RepID=A0A9R1XFQ7_LACSA|nr:hypothetical protein LSAT_V11C500283730 [Lactuca sativa]
MTKNLMLSLLWKLRNVKHYLLDRVVRLILTLLISTATTDRRFSAMKIFKNRICNKISDEFLANNLVVYIEIEIVENINTLMNLKTLKVVGLSCNSSSRALILGIFGK